MGVSKFFNTHSISIPQDVAIFGFSNWFMSTVVTPALSTVNQPNYELGQKAIEILLEEIALSEAKKEITPQKIILPTSLNLREST